MEIWATIGFGMALILGGVATLWVGQRLMTLMSWGDTVTGLGLLVLTAVYASWGTWMITTSSIPFTL